MFKFGFQPEELNEEFSNVSTEPTEPASNNASAPIPCVDCVEIHPTAEQLVKSPATLKHGLILFAGGQEVVHLKSDVLIEDLIEDQIQQRLHEERAERAQKVAEAAAKSGCTTHGYGADQHATDLIPGVYEGKHPTQRPRYANATTAARPLYEFRSQNNHRQSHRRCNDYDDDDDNNNNNDSAPSKRRHHRHDVQRTSKATSSSNRRAEAHRRHRDDNHRSGGHPTVISINASQHQRLTTHPTRHQRRNNDANDHTTAQSAPCVDVSPAKKRGRNELRHPWFNADLAALIALRERAHRKWLANKRRRKDDANWEAFRRCRSAVSAVRRTVRNDYLAGALHVDRCAPMPWQTKGILIDGLAGHRCFV